MVELAMTDLLRKAQLPELSYYQAGGGSNETHSNKRSRKESTASVDEGGYHPVFTGRKESSEGTAGQEAEPSSSNYVFSQQMPQYSIDREGTGATSLVTAPMGSLYEVTQLSENRESSPGRQYVPDQALVTDFISRGVLDLQEADQTL